jgi:hypothetical protein
MLCLILYTVVFKFIKIKSLEYILKLVPGLAGTIVILYFISPSALVLAVILSPLVYFFLAYLTGCLRKEDFILLFELVKKKSYKKTWFME